MPSDTAISIPHVHAVIFLIMHRKAINHLKRADPVLARVIERVGPCRYTVRADGTHFDAVVRAIVYQQLSGSAAFTIHSRLLGRFGGVTPQPQVLLDTPDSELRALGLSRQKTGYLKDLSRRVACGEVPLSTLHDLDDDAIITALTTVKGVGVWTAQMFLMFRLGRPDVLPDLDLGIRKAIQRAYRTRGLPTSERVQRIGAPWSPFSSVACWYLWRSLELADTSGTPAAKRQGGSGARQRGTRKETRARRAAR